MLGDRTLMFAASLLMLGLFLLPVAPAGAGVVVEPSQ